MEHESKCHSGLPDPYEEPFLSVPETVAFMGHGSRSHGYVLAASGEIPTVRVGRKLLVPTSWLYQRAGLPLPERVAS